jgi:hypothetical protein
MRSGRPGQARKKVNLPASWRSKRALWQALIISS